VGWSNLADVLRRAGNFAEAVIAGKKAIEIEPGMTSAWLNFGVISIEHGDRDEAESAFRRAVELDDTLSAAWSGLGGVLERRDALAEAVAAHERAVSIDSRNATCVGNLVRAYWKAKQPGKAVAVLKRVVPQFPHHAGLRADLVNSMLEICDWSDLDLHLSWLAGNRNWCVAGQEVTPFGSILWCDDEAKNLEVARFAAARISRRFRPGYSFAPAAGRKNDRIRIGYLSSDFHNHATLHLMSGVFREHDQSHFGIYCYSTGVNDGSAYRANVESTSEVFRDISHLNFSAAAKQIADDAIDILIDLKGWTGGTRLEICALRPAPLLMSYLGYPGSTGADFIDYAIVDEKVAPGASREHYSEQLVYMPHCYQANDDRQEVADEAMTRRDAGLPEKAIVFCSFNRPEKIDPVMFGAWVRIMQRVPDAVLWLMVGNPTARANLVNEATQCGLSAERLIFADAMPKARHLRRSRLADIVLDTRIYNGHTTTSDALWAGVPVITLTGKQFASRVSESCLAAVGFPELVTHTLDEYEALAVHMAEDAELRQGLRDRLWSNRLTQPLFDTRRFTRNLENAYRTAWTRYCEGRPAASFKVIEV
jgi:predicted O-linked N-acetylglucosamine transferase (SPINDLY family)